MRPVVRGGTCCATRSDGRVTVTRLRCNASARSSRLKSENLEEYKALHADAWPSVLAKIHECNIRNYSIYLVELRENEYYLFGYVRRTFGEDFEADMAKMAEDPTTQQWWKLTDPCQIPLDTRKEGEWWASMELGVPLRLTPKERVRAAFAHEEGDRVPAVVRVVGLL